MRHKTTSLLLAAAFLAMPLSQAAAQTPTPHKTMEAPQDGKALGHDKLGRHEKWKNATPEQREAWKAKKKAKWDSMSAEQKAEIKAKREKFKNATPEEKAAMKQKWQEKKGLKAQ